MDTLPALTAPATTPQPNLDGSWARPIGGFRWSASPQQVQPPPPDAAPSQRFLVPREGAAVEFQRYPLLKNRGLLADFLRLGQDASPAAVLAFANRWGSLTMAPHVAAPQPESLAFWQHEVWRFRLLQDDWTAVSALMPRNRGAADVARRARLTLQLRQRFQWLDAPQRVEYRAGIAADGRSDLPRNDPNGLFAIDTVLWPATVEPSLFGRWDRDDVIRPALYLIHQRLNQRLQHHIQVGVTPLGDGKLHMFPDTLLTALYLLFSVDFSQPMSSEGRCGNPKCPNNGHFFKRRRDQRFCDKNCRELAAYYRRKSATAPA